MKKIDLSKLKINKLKVNKDSILKLKKFINRILILLINFFQKIKEFFNFRPVKISLIVIILIIAVVQAVFAVLIYGFKSDHKITTTLASIIPYPVAIINSDIVRYDEFLHERNYIHKFYTATEQEGIDYEEVDRQIVDQLIENKILRSQARRYKIKVEKSEVEEAVNVIIEQNNGIENVEKVLADLYGLSIDQFKKLIELQILRENVNEQLISRVEASHILIRVEDPTEEKIAAAKTKILEIDQKLKDGMNFAEAAKEYSEDAGSASEGGKLGSFARGEMVTEFSDMAFKTKIGEVSEPVLTEFGWHLIKVEGKSGNIDKAFGDWISDLKDASLTLKLYEI